MSAARARAGVAALLIGATGTFSPCGLSVIDTIGPTGHTGGRRDDARRLRDLPARRDRGRPADLRLARLARRRAARRRRARRLCGRGGDRAAGRRARGARDRIVPQIRRQLPEHWRRVMPMPWPPRSTACCSGLGFTTFVLSFGVWALAGVSLALGDPSLGLVLGVAFGIGRAIPIVVLAPLAGSSSGHPGHRVDVRARRRLSGGAPRRCGGTHARRGSR